MGFEFAPARGSLARVSDFIMTSQSYITVEHVRTWLLGSSLTKFLQFWSACFFFAFLQFISSWLQSSSWIVAFRVPVCQGVVWFRLEVYFFRLKSSNGFPVKLIFGRSFFCTFVCSHGALILRLQVLALSASVTMARPAKTSQKLNINRLDLRVRIFRQL